MDQIVVSGAREHNLKDVTVAIPRDSLTVITGLSGSGKSSLAFDTIYAEGQRRYVESLSAYARQFLGQMDKPDVDSIEGLSPAISIDQKTTSRNPRSTVGTVTEIYDYLRLLWARIGHPHCHICGRPIAGQSAEQIIDQVMELPEGTRFMVLAPIVRGRKGEYGKQFEELRAEGFGRVKVDGELRRLDEEIVLDKKYKHDIAVVVDRLVMKGELRKRLADSIETAVALADGLVEIELVDEGGKILTFSEKFACPVHGPEPGRARAADLLVQLAPRRLPALHRPRLADGDRSRARRARPDAVDRRGRDRPVGGERLQLLRPAHPGDRRALRRRPRDAVAGPARRRRATSSCYGTGGDRVQVSYRNRFGRRRSYATQFEGIVPNLERRYRETDSDFSREKIEEYMTLRPCPDCKGARLRPESRAVLVAGTPIHEFTALSARRALEWVRALELTEHDRRIARLVLREIEERLQFLENVGDRLPVDGARVGDAVGRRGAADPARHPDRLLAGRRALHPRRAVDRAAPARQREADRARCERLRDLGNTVLVVEHDEGTMRAADHLVDMGPGAGEHGGHVVAQGTAAEVAKVADSLTGQFLAGTRAIELPAKRRKPAGYMTIEGAAQHNLQGHRRQGPARRAVLA